MKSAPRPTLLSLCCGLALAAAVGLAAANPKASQFYEDALQRFEKKDYPGAIVQLRNSLKLDSKQLAVHMLLGKALLANGEVNAAEVAFTEASRLGISRAELVLPLARAVVAQGKQRELLDGQRFDPAGLPPATQAQLLLLRAGAAADLGDLKAAFRSIEDARKLDPASADTWVAEVPVRIRARQLPEALAAADKALAITPGQADALYLRGTVLHVQGDRKGAQAAYDAALKAKPDHTEALVSRAGLALDNNRLDDALRDAKELLQSSPREPRGQYLRAQVAERQGDSNTAKAALKEVTALLDPAPLAFYRYRPQLLMLGGLAHHALGQKEKAKPYLEGVQRLQPTSPASKLLAQIYLSENNIDRGIESLEGYLRGSPGDAQAVHLLASAHMAQGRYARASQLMQDALRLQDQPQLRALLGLSLLSGGKTADAVAELEATLRKDPSQVQAGTALATIYMQSGKPQQALVVAEALLKRQPDNPGLLNMVGLVRTGAGDVAGARKAFEQAAKADTKFTAPQVNLARLDRSAGEYQKAADRLNAVLRADDKNVDALTEIGLVLERTGRLADAQRWLEKAADHATGTNLDPALNLVEYHLRTRNLEGARESGKRLAAKAPEDLRVLLMLARVSLAGGDTTAARTGLTRAAGLASYDAQLLFKVAMLQMQADHPAGAAHSLDKALAEQPNYLPAQALLAEVELRQGDMAKAERRARQIVAQHPKLAIGHALLGDVARARKDNAGMLDSYRKAHQLEQTGASLLRLHAALAVSDGKAAAQLAEKWLAANPGDVAVRRALADGYARQGNFAAARTAYEGLIKVSPDDAEALNNLANVLILAGDNAGALKQAQAALQKAPGRPHIIGTAGWAHFKAGQTDRALQLLRDARLRDPNNPDTRYFLGAVLASAGRKTEARDELTAALAGGTGFASAKDAQELLQTLR
jgi:cellulose synthase operon protein C